jgi:predicted DNA-binding protein
MARSRKDGGPVAKTTLYLPEDLMQRLKHLAVDRHCTVTDLIKEAVENLLAQEDKVLGKTKPKK